MDRMYLLHLMDRMYITYIMRILTDEWIEQGICQSYRDGISMSGIQAHLLKHSIKVSLTTIRYHLKQRGVELRPRGGVYGRLGEGSSIGVKASDSGDYESAEGSGQESAQSVSQDL